MPHEPRSARTLRSGVAAGAVSAFLFTALHHLLISDIWFSLLPMLAAGALCGLCLAWSYVRLFPSPAVGSWLRYNATYVVLIALLGLVSVIVFEPVATIPELLAANAPPRALFRRAMPLTVAFTLAAAALIQLRWGRGLASLASVLLTCTVLVALLGLNVSVLGLVHIPGSAAHLVVELFALILALAVGYAAAFLALERQWFGLRLATGVADAPGT